jgi:hypothetical protein
MIAAGRMGPRSNRPVGRRTFTLACPFAYQTGPWGGTQ